MKTILKAFGNNNSNRELNKVAEGVRKAFKSVKAELDDHLDSINQNTSEIQANQCLLAELEAKIEKLSERLDEFELMINPERARKLDVRLTPREQEVFMMLYLNKEAALKDIARRLGFTENMVSMYLLNITSKGIPVRRELVDDVLVFSLDSEFKELQARRKVLEIDSRISSQLSVSRVPVL